MSVNLLTAIQANLGYPVLQKIDPNTQEVVKDDATPDEHRFSQAAIPAVLIGLYTYIGTDKGAENILRGNIATNWAATIFSDLEKEVVEKIISYSGVSAVDASVKLNAIAAEAVRLTRESLGDKATSTDVRKFVADQRHNVLPYLPAALHIGELVNDDTIDDNTNKMEGPISSLMQIIGDKFSTPETVNGKSENQ